MLDYMKPIGAFLENTIRPLISEMKWFIDELEVHGIKVNEQNINSVTKSLFNAYCKYALIQLVQNVIITVIICLTIYQILA